jgi:hypothetical protein
LISLSFLHALSHVYFFLILSVVLCSLPFIATLPPLPSLSFLYQLSISFVSLPSIFYPKSLFLALCILSSLSRYLFSLFSSFLSLRFLFTLFSIHFSMISSRFLLHILFIHPFIYFCSTFILFTPPLSCFSSLSVSIIFLYFFYFLFTLILVSSSIFSSPSFFFSIIFQFFNCISHLCARLHSTRENDLIRRYSGFFHTVYGIIL